MKRHLFLAIAAALLFCHAKAQQLTAAEYYFDTDPGVGNGTALTVTTGDSILYSGSIITTGLPNGFHFLYIRSKDANGTWSLTERRMFFIQTGAPASPALAAAEYFFDTDPGVGNGIPLVVVGGDSILFSGSIPSGALIKGFHFLYIRTKGLDNKWGLAERRMLYIQSPPTVSPILVAAEYFVNTDPGVGNATALTVVSGDSIDFSGPITVTDTVGGDDSLFIRVRDLSGLWSLYEGREFHITLIGIDEIAGNGGSGLFQNYPNPFSHSTTIDYYLHNAGAVTFYITDLAGRTVMEIKKGVVPVGKHSVQFSNASLQEGYYFYQIVAGDFTATRQMVYLKE
jgi:hypothetical protein